MKDLPYFPHYIGARNDPKIVEVEMDMKGQGKSIWWDLVEMLWENGGYLPMNYKKLAYSLRYATTDEVERVVTQFGLFENDGERFWNKLLLEFIEHKRRVSETNSNNRRGSRSTTSERPLNGPSTTVERPFNDPSTSPLINKVNKEIKKEKKDNNIMIPPTADFIYEIFFFRNLKNPSSEVSRFLKHYEDCGWTYQDGTPIEDVEKVARDWKPAKAGDRADTEALNWYHAIFNSAKNSVGAARDIFLDSLSAIRRKDNKLALVFITADAARKAAAFIQEHDLGGDWQLDFRVSN